MSASPTVTLIRPNLGDYRSSDALAPLSMAILAARTPAHFRVRFYDDKVESIPFHEHTDLVAMTVETFTARRAYEIAAGYRDRGIPVVMGGYHPTLIPQEAMRHADSIVIGDAEGSWERLLADFEAGRMREQYHADHSRPLDDYRMRRDIFQGKKYGPVELIQYSRGCRFACDFCSIRSFYRKSLRLRPVADVVAEIRAMPRRKLFFFVDDNLFASMDSLHALLEALEPLNIRWSCQISIDVARNTRLLDAMARAGCVFVLIGFESLSSANLKQMGKPWNRVAGDYLAVVRQFHRRGMAVYGTFVFGYDDDTEQTITQSVAFARKARLEMANFNPLTPTPGSPLYERLKAQDRLLYPQWWLDPGYRCGDAIFIPKSISPREFSRCCFEAKKSFYSWYSIFNRVLGSYAGLHWFRTPMVGMVNLVSRQEVYRKQYRVLG